jgi:5-formyltetrahydrofolate cyclo-ligase
VRRQALSDGKIVYMAVPRLRTEKCFVEIDPKRVGRRIALAASIKGASKYGRLVSPREMRPIDLIVCGSVAVRRDGTRVGKGGGFADLEYALREGARSETTPSSPPCTPDREKVACSPTHPLDSHLFQVVASRRVSADARHH